MSDTPITDPVAPEGAPDPTAEAPVAPIEPSSEGDAPLGPEGEKALQIWKERARAAEREAQRVARLEAELAELRKAQMTDQERAVEEAREAARAEVLESVRGDRFLDKLAAISAGKVADAELFADPTVALRLLGFDSIPVTEDGGIDGEAISSALASLIERKPYLAASATHKPGPIDQGARTSVPPASLDDQIREAEKAGDWALAGQLKLQKLAALPQP